MDIAAIIERIEAVPLQNGRRLIAIAGAPASGKSTLSAGLAERLPNAAVIPMDGFHRDNDDLTRHGLLARKGAPETFEAEAFVDFVSSLKEKAGCTYPTFDRENDCVVPDGGKLVAQMQTILVEGNYLLLNRPPWNRLTDIWDLTIMVNVALPSLQERLVARWVEHNHDVQSALERALSNDIPNARLVLEQSLPANLVI